MCEENTACDAKPLAQLRYIAGRYEIVYPEYDLIVRGHYAEWVLHAAAEIIEQTERLRTNGSIEELEMLSDFDESIEATEIDAAKYEARARFSAVPQCVISMGANDYRWIHPEGRNEEDKSYVQRLHDQSLTRKPDSWLADEARN